MKADQLSSRDLNVELWSCDNRWWYGNWEKWKKWKKCPAHVPVYGLHLSYMTSVQSQTTRQSVGLSAKKCNTISMNIFLWRSHVNLHILDSFILTFNIHVNTHYHILIDSTFPRFYVLFSFVAVMLKAWTQKHRDPQPLMLGKWSSYKIHSSLKNQRESSQSTAMSGGEKTSRTTKYLV